MGKSNTVSSNPSSVRYILVLASLLMIGGVIGTLLLWPEESHNVAGGRLVALSTGLLISLSATFLFVFAKIIELLAQIEGRVRALSPGSKKNGVGDQLSN